jgi:hypothetical protein
MASSACQTNFKIAKLAAPPLFMNMLAVVSNGSTTSVTVNQMPQDEIIKQVQSRLLSTTKFVYASLSLVPTPKDSNATDRTQTD